MGYRVVKKAWQYVQPFWYSTSVWRTDRWIDIQPISITCFSIAEARKNRPHDLTTDRTGRMLDCGHRGQEVGLTLKDCPDFNQCCYQDQTFQDQASSPSACCCMHFKNTRWDRPNTDSPSLAGCGLINRPPWLNTLSTGADVAGTDKYSSMTAWSREKHASCRNEDSGSVE